MITGSLYDTVNGLRNVKAYVNRKNQIFNLYEQFYTGTEYKSDFIKRYYKLYSATREFYSLISRAVDIDTEIIPGDWRTTSNQKEVDDILKTSNWEKYGALYVHYGALFGDFYLKIYTDENEHKIEPVDPRGVWLGTVNGEYQSIITRNVQNFETGNLSEQGEIITETTVKLYENGKQYDEYPNPYGFVPVYYGKYKDTGLDIGLNCFHNVIESINAVNEMATFLQEQMIRALVNQKVITGAQAAELEFGPEKTIFLPQGAKMDVLKGELDVTGALDFIKDIKQEVKQSLPEFVFDSLRAPNLERPNSEGALKLYAQELITKIKRARIGFDETLKNAINGVRLANGESELDFYFDRKRPVLPLINVSESERNTNDTQSVTEDNNNGMERRTARSNQSDSQGETV